MSCRQGILYGTHAHHAHAQNIAQALQEGAILAKYVACGVDHYNTEIARWARGVIEWTFPRLDAKLKRRRVDRGIPEERIGTEWGWEVPLAFVSKIAQAPRLADWIWERSEWRLDEKLAASIREESYQAFFGAEHGALKALHAAKDVGIPGLLAFFSPHHKAVSRWVYSEYERYPSLLTPYRKRIMDEAPRRNKRKDREMELADFIHVPSSLVKRTLVEGGADSEKIFVDPIGCPPPRASEVEEDLRSSDLIFAGNVSVQKGVHYLIKAWNRLNPRSGERLHLYGKVTLPRRIVETAGPAVTFHGSVSQETLFQELKSCAALVLPTLLDGFGMVVGEALAHGVPVVTTTNAGAADLIREGENGFVVPPADPEALAERMEWILQNPDRLAEMRPCARETAAGWQWEDFRGRLRAQIEASVDLSSQASTESVNKNDRDDSIIHS